MKNLIVLQENSGQIDFLNSIGDTPTRQLVKGFIDKLAETFESIKTGLQVSGYYDSIINLTDVNCTRAKLLNALGNQAKEGNMVDLLILGHGSPKKLYLHGEVLKEKDIESLLSDAQKAYPRLQSNLRLVYMCNCYGASLAAAWHKIGAKTVLGCEDVNYMPEPQTTYFFDDFVKKGNSAKEACRRSFEASNNLWSVTGLSLKSRKGSVLVLSGQNIVFDGRRIGIGEKVDRNIYANNTHNHTNVYIIKGEQYEFTVPSNQKWKNGSKETSAKGYTKGPFDFPRQSSYNVMALVGELINNNNNVLSYNGTHFGIGNKKTWAATQSGYLVCHANDGLAFYGDNSGKLTLEIKRIS